VALSLLVELKRRRVFRALVGYGIAAFAVLQIVEPVAHGLHWPEAVLSYVVVALAAGFPIVVTLAWIFDVQGGRFERTEGGRPGLRRLLLLAGIGVLAAAPGLICTSASAAGARPAGIAVHRGVALRESERRQGERVLLRRHDRRDHQRARQGRGRSRRRPYFRILLQGKNLDVRKIGES